MTIRLLLSCLVLFSFGCVKNTDANHIPAFSQFDFPVRTMNEGSRELKFRIYVPKGVEPSHKMAVMLYLHGSDERGNDNESQLSGLAPLIIDNPKYFRFIIVFPQCPAGRFWDKEMIERAMAELDQTVKEFSIAESRLDLAGFSLGGYGVWTAAAMYPGKFAAIVPMSGRVLPRPTERTNVDQEILKLADEPDPFTAFAKKIGNTPVWIFHGAHDPIVPVENSRQMARAFKEVGNNRAKYTEFKNTGHVSLNAVFSDQEFFEWLAKQSE
jgi:predicted peptidase